MGDCFGDVSFLKPLDDALDGLLCFFVHYMSPRFLSMGGNHWLVVFRYQSLDPILFTFGHPLGDLLLSWGEDAKSYLHLRVDVL